MCLFFLCSLCLHVISHKPKVTNTIILFLFKKFIDLALMFRFTIHFELEMLYTVWYICPHLFLYRCILTVTNQSWKDHPFITELSWYFSQILIGHKCEFTWADNCSVFLMLMPVVHFLDYCSFVIWGYGESLNFAPLYQDCLAYSQIHEISIWILGPTYKFQQNKPSNLFYQTPPVSWDTISRSRQSVYGSASMSLSACTEL